MGEGRSGDGERVNEEGDEGKWGGVAVGGQRRGEGGREMERQRHTEIGRWREEKGLQTNKNEKRNKKDIQG